MEQLSIHTRSGWPEGVPTLLATYPRDDWDTHPNLREPTRNWMGAHRGFRQLSAILRESTEAYLDRDREVGQFAARLSYYGSLLTRNLHGHHTWEDRSFFPEINGVDPRFAQGLETLEGDHEVLDETLARFSQEANRVIQLAQLEEAQVRNEAGPLHETISGLEGFLERHLTDEEDLIVPIILHHKMRG